MIEPTEREKKLINYIMFLIGMLNSYSVFIVALYKNMSAMEKWLKPLQEENSEREMIEFLNTEFGINLSLKLDKDYLEERLKNG